MQTASAFSSVQGALSFFVSSTVYRQLAEWRAVIDRLAGSSARSRRRAPPPSRRRWSRCSRRRMGGAGSNSPTSKVKLPTGRPLVAADDIALPQGEHVLFTGPSGSGKSTLVPRHRRHLAVRLGHASRCPRTRG